jgi:hypothetical protein
MEGYVYRPLPETPCSTRLLQILPGDNGTNIYCLIFDYTLQTNRASGPYEALSYVWGDPTERRRIFVQDAEAPMTKERWSSYLDITTNLYSALQRLRDPFIPRMMWIDAVCIDQTNLQERAAQVQFMVSIYSHAHFVIAWLGEEADNSTEVLASLEDLDMDPPLQASLYILLARSWFQRIWVYYLTARFSRTVR